MSPSPPPATAPTAFLALGSNLGDRRANLAEALARLEGSGFTRILARSSLYATEPMGLPGAPEFLNAVVAVATGRGPEELLADCLAIEAAMGRVRTGRTESRRIDLDVLAYGARRLAGPTLILPHPRMTVRAFVLQPLAEIAPGMTVEGKTAAEWAALAGWEGVRRVGAFPAG